MSDSLILLANSTNIATDEITENSKQVHMQRGIVERVRDRFDLNLSRNAIDGLSGIRKFGHNAAVGTAAEDLWIGGGAYSGFLTVADEVRIRAGGDAADAAAGLGAQKVVVEGLDANFLEISETIVTNGTSVSTKTTLKFIRVFRAFVTDCGTYGASNTAAITVETEAGAIVAVIAIEEGQTQQAIYTIPAAKTGYLVQARFWVDTNQDATVWVYKRQDADTIVAPFTAKRVVTHLVGIENQAVEKFDGAAIELPARCDVWIAAKSGAGTAVVSGQLDLILVDD